MYACIKYIRSSSFDVDSSIEKDVDSKCRKDDAPLHNGMASGKANISVGM